MTQGAEQELFGELRSMLAQPNKDEAWGGHLMNLLDLAHEHLGQEQYEQVWSPYLQEAQASLPQPLFTLRSSEEFEHAIMLAPSALFALALEIDSSGDEGAAALASCPYLSNLTSLDLNANTIGAQGAAALATSPPLSNLTKLELGYNDIGDEGAAALADSPYLCELIRQQWRRA